MTRFIHTADWHIGNPFSGFNENEQTTLSAARFEAVAALLNYADRESIRLMLCAGDQLDSTGPRRRKDLLGLFGIIAEHPQVTVVMIAGNHDPAGPGSPWETIDAELIPANIVTITDRRILPLTDHGIVIVATSLSRKFGTENPLNWYRGAQSPRGAAVVGLAHGSLAIEGRYSSDDFPVPPDFAAQVGLDYLALGHWHSQYIATAHTAYPGTPEPLTFGDEGGALDVTIPSPGEEPQVAAVDVAQYHWVEKTIDFDSEPVTDSSAIGILRKKLESIPDPEKSIVRLSVTGRVGAAEAGRITDLISMYEGRFFRLSSANRLGILPTDEELAAVRGEGYMPAVVEELLHRKQTSPEEAAVVDRALLRIYDHFSAFNKTNAKNNSHAGELS